MSGEGSLLERIRSAALREDLQASRDPDEVARSICRNLERVLNNWRGSAPIEPELGLPDDAYGGSSRERIGRAVAALLRNNVQSFEPRLKEVQVLPVEQEPSDVGAWAFRVQGRLVTAEGRPRVALTIRRRTLRYTVDF